MGPCGRRVADMPRLCTAVPHETLQQLVELRGHLEAPAWVVLQAAIGALHRATLPQDEPHVP